MTVLLQAKPPRGSTPIHLTTTPQWARQAKALPPETRRWLAATGFTGAANSHALVPTENGALREVWAGVRDAEDPWLLAALPRALPPGRYHIGDGGLVPDPCAAALSWELGAYAFDLYKKPHRDAAQLALADMGESRRGVIMATAMAGARDLVNTPAEHMGPAELAAAVRLVAQQHKAKVREVVGDELLSEGFPAVHAVGRAAARAPRLVESSWSRQYRQSGNGSKGGKGGSGAASGAHDPLITLVGKGVCFDSGGLDLKSADGMRLMKKDMGGAASALALAQMIMALELPVRLQLLIPAVENAVSGNAFRPGDIFKTRAGLHIEIGNTDAEGRVILCDALAYGAEGQPDLMLDMATLTGAARTALGPQLPALFCRDMAMARELVDLGLVQRDPLWHMPLWRDYHGLIESDIADIVNTGKGAMAGAITAALFLDDFVPASVPWLHIDLFAWNDSAKPGRPIGGEAQTVRTLLAWLERRYGSSSV